ncbi:hypothetical protein GGR25_003497 [Kaistia hirudinis]|uniref:Insertion element IS402-like domain-containing protein n=1 Tax=Kaistia hirudinis TaxID=1293440 RepID=A0A840AQ86_9HYPH|nr:hypothetical protein [Kaistia hirudinis]
MLNGIDWRLRTGSPWADILERHGPATTCYNRLVRWRKLGVWDRIFAAVSAAYDGDLQMIDSSSVRVHQHAANVKKGPRLSRGGYWDEPHTRCMGRAPGGLSTKIHAPADRARMEMSGEFAASKDAYNNNINGLYGGGGRSLL